MQRLKKKRKIITLFASNCEGSFLLNYFTPHPGSRPPIAVVQPILKYFAQPQLMLHAQSIYILSEPI